MKFLFFSIFFIFNVQAKSIRMVQAAKSFLGDITDEQAGIAYDDPSIEEKYNVKELKVSVGDKLIFANRDEVSHNVSAKKDGETLFDVTLQKPGAKFDKELEMTKKGEYEIQCAIHPKMKIKLIIN